MTVPHHPPPLGPVEVGTRELYELGLRTQAAVERMNDKLDGHNGQLVDHEARLRALEGKPRTDDHEARLRALERARWPLPTVTALLALAAVVIAAIGLLTRG